ncbi:MAG: hypothetical protein IJV11_04225 [Muribaculaceae bacterium]|nr:hypothetical protein [Muribaculaceae bacterium]
MARRQPGDMQWSPDVVTAGATHYSHDGWQLDKQWQVLVSLEYGESHSGLWNWIILSKYLNFGCYTIFCNELQLGRKITIFFEYANVGKDFLAHFGAICVISVGARGIPATLPGLQAAMRRGEKESRGALSAAGPWTLLFIYCG